MKKMGLDRQTSVVAPQCSTVVQEREAKRVRLLNFWAKRGIVQKGPFTYDVRKIDPSLTCPLLVLGFSVKST